MNAQRLLVPKILLATTAALCGLLDSQNVEAQVQRYQPSSPTVSPYLNLTRFNSGSMPNYYSLVRPLQQQRTFNLQEQALRKQQATSLGKLHNDLQRATTASGTGTGSWFMQPGSRSTFLNTTRYYPQPGIRGQRR
jgi:hypothetical protein